MAEFLIQSFGGLPTTQLPTEHYFGGSPGPSSALIPSNSVSSPNEEKGRGFFGIQTK
jgi:hypothetical protein